MAQTQTLILICVGGILFFCLACIVVFVYGFKRGFRYFYRCVNEEKDIKIYLSLSEILGDVMRIKNRKEPDKVKQQRFWKDLWGKACDRARTVEDSRLAVLERYSKEPEKILRKFNIISQADIDREFGQ